MLKSRLVSKKNYRQKDVFLENEHFEQTPPNSKKMHLLFFPISTEGIKAKLSELESESESFLSKVKIYHYHLPITT